MCGKLHVKCEFIYRKFEVYSIRNFKKNWIYVYKIVLSRMIWFGFVVYKKGSKQIDWLFGKLIANKILNLNNTYISKRGVTLFCVRNYL